MITIKIDNEKLNAKISAFKNKHARLFSMKTVKQGVIAAVLAGSAVGTGAVYAESDFYRQHKAAALQTSKISAGQAVDLALQKVNGHAVSVDFEHKLGDVGEISNMAGKRYEVDIITGTGEKHEVGVDADSGSIVYDKTKSAKRTFAQPKISLQQAMQTAATQTGGTVKDAELDHDDGMIQYEISTVSAQGMKQKVRVNADTGEVLAAYEKKYHHDD